MVCADRCSVVFLLASPQRENAKIAHRRPSNLRRIVRRVLRQVLEEQRLLAGWSLEIVATDFSAFAGSVRPVTLLLPLIDTVLDGPGTASPRTVALPVRLTPLLLRTLPVSNRLAPP